MSTFNSTTSYKANLNDLFSEWDSLFSHKHTNAFTNYSSKDLDNGKVELSVNVLGHSPKDISLEVTEENLLSLEH